MRRFQPDSHGRWAPWTALMDNPASFLFRVPSSGGHQGPLVPRGMWRVACTGWPACEPGPGPRDAACQPVAAMGPRTFQVVSWPRPVGDSPPRCCRNGAAAHFRRLCVLSWVVTRLFQPLSPCHPPASPQSPFRLEAPSPLGIHQH